MSVSRGCKIMQKLPLSVCLVSFNEEANIARTLDSIKDIASEIVLVDSHSTDKTRDIAASYDAKIFEQEWNGYVAQKNIALAKCTQEYILSLDCDEVVSNELRNSIVKAIGDAEAEGFYINRKMIYLGKLLKYTWQPEWKLRFVKRAAKPEWQGYEVHETLKIQGKTKKLRGDLYHYSYKDLEDQLKRTLMYSKLSAASYHKMGRRFRVYNLTFNPLIAFIKLYVLQKGFLDGVRGLSVAAFQAFYTFMKYMLLWEIEYMKRR